MAATISDLTIITLPAFRDGRGTLSVVEASRLVPFAVGRVFWIKDVPAGTARGGHAHKACHQYMICLQGRIRMVAFDGMQERALTLEAGDAVHVPPGLFTTEYFDMLDSVLLVLCDAPYDAADYLTTRQALIDYREISA